MEDKIKAIGKLNIVLTGPDGKVKDERTVDNLVVNTGKSLIAARLSGAVTGSNAIASHIAIGTNNTAPSVSNTTLATELVRVGLTGGAPSLSGTSVGHTVTFAPGTGTGAIVEAGIFNAASSGTMIARTTFSTINKGSLDTLTITWNITIS